MVLMVVVSEMVVVALVLGIVVVGWWGLSMVMVE